MYRIYFFQHGHRYSIYTLFSLVDFCNPSVCKNGSHSQDKQYTNTGRIRATELWNLFKYTNKHDICTFSVVSSMVYLQEHLCLPRNVKGFCSGPCVCCTYSHSCGSYLPSNKMCNISTGWRCPIHYLLEMDYLPGLSP